MIRTLLVMLVFVAAGCASTKKEPPPKPFVGTRWQVLLELPVAGEQPYVRFGDGRMEGFGGCNRFMARYTEDTVGARSIAIGRIEVIRRLCDPSKQAAESRVLEVLQSVSSYSVTADTLTMTGSGGTLRFLAVPVEAVPAAAAPAPAPVAAAASLAGTRWMGVIDAAVDSRVRPWLEFLAEGRVSGFTGCNLLNGAWKSEGGQVRIGPLAMTKRGCMGPADDIERRLIASVNEQARVTREGGKLVMVGPSGERFEFIEAASTPR